MQAFILEKSGGIDVLKLQKIEDPKPKKDEVLIRHTAIGVNFFDICFRRGQYEMNSQPPILGFEGCGIIEAVGQGVVDFKPGQRVSYATGPFGSYCEKRVINQRHLVVPPKNLTDVQVAGSLFKGLTAHALLYRVYIAKRVKRILIHAAAGGVGQFLVNFAKHLGIEVIGTVGSDEKIAFARTNGCDHVINYTTQDFVAEVAKITDHHGVGVVYDGVGKNTLEKSLECLWPMGMCVTFGEASGTTENLDLGHLFLNSLYITRPTTALYKSNRVELVLSANEVFAALQKNILRPKITSFNFKDAAKAHELLESRASVGSLVLTF
jgi:NADPH2:quinone reductase